MRTKQDFIQEILGNAILIHAAVDMPEDPVLYDWNYFVNDTTPEPPHIIGRGILPQKAIMVLAGEPKVGKSHMALSMAYYIAAGHDWFNFSIEIPHRCLILQAENSYYNQRKRVQLINHLTELPDLLPKLPENQLVLSDPIHTMDFGQESGYDYTMYLIDRYTPQVLFIDPLVNFHSVEENSNSEMARVMGRLHKIKNEADVSIVLIHHQRKPSGLIESPGISLRGASSIRGAYDTGLTLTELFSAEKGHSYHKLEFELRNGPPIEPLNLKLDPTCLTFKADMMGQKAEDYIVEILTKVGIDGLLRKDVITIGKEQKSYSESMMKRALISLRDKDIIIEENVVKNKHIWLKANMNTLPF